jgi:hypothetical protein
MKMLTGTLVVVALTALSVSSVFAQQRMVPHAAYYGGTYFGQDPDINIVGSLDREASASVGN